MSICAEIMLSFKLIYGLNSEAYCSLLSENDLELLPTTETRKKTLRKILESYQSFDFSVQFLQKIPSLDQLFTVKFNKNSIIYNKKPVF